jgi:hypothetical protein
VKTRGEYVTAVKRRFDEAGIDIPYPIIETVAALRSRPITLRGRKKTSEFTIPPKAISPTIATATPNSRRFSIRWSRLSLLIAISESLSSIVLISVILT